MEITVHDLPNLAQEILEKVVEKNVCMITFSGELGAGKTTLIKEIAKQLGVVHEVQSPTFVIYKIYETNHPVFKKLVHADMYRLESGEEIEKLGWQELVNDPSVLLCVEWPEKIEEVIPKGVMKITLHHGKDENTRLVNVI